MKKMLLIVISIILIAALVPVIFAVFVTQTEKRQHDANATFETGSYPEKTSSLVCYFSRSKNTEVLAKTLAQRTHSGLYPIVDDHYEIGVKGWINANQDARSTAARNSYESLDLSQVDTLYIGSPIWWYSPAPPVWEFVNANDLQSVKVVLFTSHNSKYEQDYIDTFAELVESKGGSFIGHVSVKRGRMGQQISQEEMIEVFQTKLDSLIISGT